MTDELVPLEQVPEVAEAAFNVSAELQKAIDVATKSIEGRSFSERHPELGKMINCRMCGTRHRETDNTYREIHDEKGKAGVQIMSVRRVKCEQVFTYRVGDYELYREDEKGELVPDYRTAVKPDEKPTMKQTMGQAAFAKKRFHPHLSRIKLQFIERTRKIFEELEFPLERAEKEEIKDFNEKFQKNLERARILAARELRAEHELRGRAARRRQDESRRINKGLL